MRLRFVFSFLRMSAGLWLLGASAAALSPTQEVPHLLPGQELELTIGMDRRPLVVTFDLGEHDFAVIEVVQRGIDVEVLDPGGPCLEGPWSVDLRKGDSGTESVPVASTSAAQPSELRLIPAAEPDAGAGEVLLRITDARQQPRARDHCRGWRAFLDGRVAALDRSAEAQLQAVSEYRRSAEIFRSLEDDAALGQALLNQAAAEHRLGRMDEALHHLSEARRRLASAESDSSRRNLVAAWIETSWIWLRKGQVELASELFGEAARLAEALGDRRSLAMALNGQGLAHKRAEDWPRAVEAYRRAAQLAEGNRCVESAARTNLGRAHTKLGEFQRGLSELSRAVELALPQSDGDSACRDLAAALNSKASLYGALGRWQIAASTFEEALRFASETMRLRLLGNYARALARVGQPDQARDVYLESIETASRTGNRDVEFATRLNLGHLYLREFDDPHRAAQQYELATAFVDPAESSRDLAHLSVLRAQLFLETSRPERAREQAIRAVELASRLGDVQQEAFAQLLLARSQLARGDAETAAATAATAVDTIEGLRSRTASFDLRATFLAERNDYFETWIRALVELHRRDASGGFAARALEVAERARSRAFLDMLDQADVERSAQVHPELAVLERRRISLFVQRQTLGSGSELERQASLDHQLAATEAAIIELRASLRASDPSWIELRQPEILDFAAMRDEVVDSETALLHSFLGERGGWLWLATSRGLEVFDLPDRTQVEQDVRRLLELLTTRSRVEPGEDLETRRERIRRADEDYRELSQRLSNALLGNVLNHAAAKRIAVVGDGPLAYLPLAALPIPHAETWRPSVLEHEWIYLPSVSVLRALNRQAERRAEVSSEATRPRLAVVADPVFSTADPRLEAVSNAQTTRTGLDRQFLRLPQSGAEARELAELAGPDSLLAVGLEAQADLVRSGRLQPYDILHFATHGVIETQHPELSALVLSSLDAAGRPIDGFLRLSDIYRLELDAELVVLSACETALGQEMRGEGLIGLTRGFQYAGASTVLASLWVIQDRATRDLMGRFYSYLLRDGLSTVEALHSAQRDLAANPASTPYHWAGFVIQGGWR